MSRKLYRKRLSKLPFKGSVFKKDANVLAKQVSDSLRILDKSLIKNENVATAQQNQMEILLNQTQKLIIQCQTTNGEMKRQQCTLNMEFDKLGEWRNKVETELLTSRGNQVEIDEKVNQAHEKSESSMGVLRGNHTQSWCHP